MDGNFRLIYADDILLGENVNTMKFTLENRGPSVRACARACVCGGTGHWDPGPHVFLVSKSCLYGRDCRLPPRRSWAFALLGCYVAYVGPIGCPEVSVTSYELTPRNIQEERNSRVRRYWIRFLRRGISLSQGLPLHKITRQ